MADGRIIIDPNIMRVRADQYSAAADNIGETIAKMNSLLAILQTEWEGEASRAYSETYESELRPAFQNAQQMVESIAAVLRQTAYSMEETDIRVANSF